MSSVEVTLSEMAEAWSKRDVDRVVNCFDKDAEYYSSVGPMPGTRACGHHSIRALVAIMFKHDHGCSTSVTHINVVDNYASWRWCYTHADGKRELGCDLFVFRDSLILLKDAYRKICVPSLVVQGVV